MENINSLGDPKLFSVNVCVCVYIYIYMKRIESIEEYYRTPKNTANGDGTF